MKIKFFFSPFLFKGVQEKYPIFQLAIKNVTAIQNATNMSTKLPIFEVRLCPFDPSLNTSHQYVCYKHEKCCRLGCCSNYRLSYHQSWYFWAIVVVVFLVFYLGSWYCKKVEVRRRRLQDMRIGNSNRSLCSSLNSTPEVSPRRSSENTVDNYLLDYLIHSYRLHTVNETCPQRPGGNAEPPPKYQEALCMPKRLRSNLQIVQIHANGCGSTENQNSESNAETLPTYEDAIQNNKGADDESNK